jgi:hypothetical protein
MRPVDTRDVFKHAVFCFSCLQENLFTLRSIAEKQELSCFGCGSMINTRDRRYSSLQDDVTKILEALGPSQTARTRCIWADGSKVKWSDGENALPT